jgi:hypothetical protein
VISGEARVSDRGADAKDVGWLISLDDCGKKVNRLARPKGSLGSNISQHNSNVEHSSDDFYRGKETIAKIAIATATAAMGRMRGVAISEKLFGFFPLYAVTSSASAALIPNRAAFCRSYFGKCPCVLSQSASRPSGPLISARTWSPPP